MHQIAALMDSLARTTAMIGGSGHHFMALFEDGQLAAARPKIERSVAANPNNAHSARRFAVR